MKMLTLMIFYFVFLKIDFLMTSCGSSFTLVGKQVNILKAVKELVHKNTWDVYNRCQEAKQKRGKTKNYSFPQQNPMESRKSIKGIKCSPMYPLSHS